MKISIIVPFYKGNKYLDRLFKSIEYVSKQIEPILEIVIVNDSPAIDVVLPETYLDIKVVVNEANLGIQGSRISGVDNSTGDWILFLDQDDELVSAGFTKQIELTENADVVVGNGIYILGKVNKKTFKNLKAMQYLVQERRLIAIRNLIPSPGECLIKREKLPELWRNNRLGKNGADDWFLWILLFKSGAKFKCNEDVVYIHNDSGGANLSANLEKMRESSLEMLDALNKNKVLNEKEIKKLNHAIEFKYNQDTKQLSVNKILKYLDAFVANIRYRLVLNLYR